MIAGTDPSATDLSRKRRPFAALRTTDRVNVDADVCVCIAAVSLDFTVDGGRYF